MNAFVQSANLPRSCSAVLYGQKYAEFLEEPLKKRGIRSILVPDNRSVDPRLSGHVDLMVFHAGGERLFLAPQLRDSFLARELEKEGAILSFPSQVQGKNYPEDAMMNICSVGNSAFLNPRSAAKEIVDFLTNDSERNLIQCKQGYSRCAICPVDGSALITADRGAAKAAERAGLSVLLISDGFIQLEGFPYGFIGGASFKISEHELAFTGTLDGHPDRDRILSFLLERKVKPVFLTERSIFDIGSAIPAFESTRSISLVLAG